MGVSTLKPRRGDFVRLDREHHTSVHSLHRVLSNGDCVIEDIHGEDFLVRHHPNDDSASRRGWISLKEFWSGQKQVQKTH